MAVASASCGLAAPVLSLRGGTVDAAAARRAWAAKTAVQIAYVAGDDETIVGHRAVTPVESSRWQTCCTCDRGLRAMMDVRIPVNIINSSQCALKCQVKAPHRTSMSFGVSCGSLKSTPYAPLICTSMKPAQRCHNVQTVTLGEDECV